MTEGTMPPARAKRGTTTSNFGVGGRESHDSTPFYARFRAPEVSNDDSVLVPEEVPEPFVCGDSRSMDRVTDGSVALVVTSPPYFAGKQYEEELEREGVPSSYLEYLQMLTDVFAECVRKLEPGGRIAVNVANLGRKPYRSLSADVIGILERDLGLLLRGELIWQKSEGASGSCAWGSFRSASNPVLRDISERVIVASKGRFDRARTVKQRKAEGLPYENTMMTEDFLGLTLDVWNMPAESARRVGHPAPFPVELPEQLIRLYTFRDDLVLDPFMGSGSALVAASRLDRRYVGYDLDPAYVDIARRRVADEGVTVEHLAADRSALEAARMPRVVGPASADGDQGDHTTSGGAPGGATNSTTSAAGSNVGDVPSDRAAVDDRRRAVLAEGLSAQKLAMQALKEAGFRVTAEDFRLPGTGVTVSFRAIDATGNPWLFDLAGALTSYRGGMLRAEQVWRSIGRAAAIKIKRGDTPFALLTTAVPKPKSEGDQALRSAGEALCHDVIDLLSDAALARLGRYGSEGQQADVERFWTVPKRTRRT